MFCSKCGMKNEDGVQFCGGCGAALIGGQSGEEMYQRQSGREELIAKLQQVLPKMIRIDNTDASIQQKKKEKEMVDKNEKGKFRVGLFLIIYILSLCALEGVLGLLTMIIGSITSHHLYFMDTVYDALIKAEQEFINVSGLDKLRIGKLFKVYETRLADYSI